jgi:hypothetical protein
MKDARVTVVCEVSYESLRNGEPFALLRQAGGDGAGPRKTISVGGDLIAREFEAGKKYRITVEEMPDEPSTTIANDPPPAPADNP